MRGKERRGLVGGEENERKREGEVWGEEENERKREERIGGRRGE